MRLEVLRKPQRWAGLHLTREMTMTFASSPCSVMYTHVSGISILFEYCLIGPQDHIAHTTYETGTEEQA